jgi:hypothetical protein
VAARKKTKPARVAARAVRVHRFEGDMSELILGDDPAYDRLLAELSEPEQEAAQKPGSTKQ